MFNNDKKVKFRWQNESLQHDISNACKCVKIPEIALLFRTVLSRQRFDIVGHASRSYSGESIVTNLLMSPMRPLVADRDLDPVPVGSNPMLVAQFQLLFANDLKFAFSEIISLPHRFCSMDIFHSPWCCKYNGGCCLLSWKYRKTQSNNSGWRPSDELGRWKSINWQLIRSDDRSVTTSVAPIHFLVLYNLQPSCSDPCKSETL